MFDELKMVLVGILFFSILVLALKYILIPIFLILYGATEWVFMGSAVALLLVVVFEQFEF